MDVEVEIKEEPIWLEETPNTSLDLCVNHSADKDNVVKVEPQTLVIPVTENATLHPRAEDVMTAPSANVRDEVCIDKRTVDQLVPGFQEENNVECVPVSTKGPVNSSDCSGKTCSRRKTLEPLSLVHSLQTPHSCTVCNRVFSTRKSLNRHQLTHSAKKRYPCTHCSREYSHKTSLTTHLLRRHTEEKRYRCKWCNKMFAQRYSIRNHLLTHSRKTLHCCPFCDSTFTGKGVLKDHLLTYCRKKPYHCTICEATFSLRFRFHLHLLTHVVSKPASELILAIGPSKD
ncbi:oocyte zinc finger protein XlCOF26 [Anabrus simplex]|uniref:oocyte zinc finger protein XlCOF26 n=1 Tax=Anabrus simplex TaxID=316456 RepID=UPI0035A3BF67